MEGIVTFGIISLLIVISPSISNLTRLPVVVVEILLGAFGYYFGVFSHSHSLELVAEIGFLFLMFLCGLEVDLKTFTKQGWGFLKSAGIYFLTLYILAGIYVFYSGISEFYIIALPIMSLGMIMMLLKEYPKDTAWLVLALNVGILGELVSIVLLVILNGAYSYGLNWELYKTLIVLFVFLSVIVGMFKIANILFWWFPSLKFIVIPKETSKNQDIRFSAMLFLTMIGISYLLNLESALGAFLAGMILATYFQHKTGLVEKLNDFGFGFFVPLFFVYVGSTLDLGLIFSDVNLFYSTLMIISAMVILRLVAAFVAYRKHFPTYIEVVQFAFSHAMPLTFLVATAQLGREFKAISTQEYYAFILAALLEAILLIVAIKFISNFQKKKLKKA